MDLLTLGLHVSKDNEEIHFCGVKKVNSAHWATLIAAYSWELRYGFFVVKRARSADYCPGAMAEFVTLGIINTLSQIILCSGVVLCMVGCLTTPLAFTYQMLVIANTCSSYDNQRCLQTLPNISLGEKSDLVENHWTIKMMKV